MLKVPWYNYAHTYICSTCMCACVYTVVSRIVRNICTETIHPVFCAKILMIRVLLGTGIPGTHVPRVQGQGRLLIIFLKHAPHIKHIHILYAQREKRWYDLGEREWCPWKLDTMNGELGFVGVFEVHVCHTWRYECSRRPVGSSIAGVTTVNG